MDGVRDPQALEEGEKGSSEGAQRAACSGEEAQHCRRLVGRDATHLSRVFLIRSHPLCSLLLALLSVSVCTSKYLHVSVSLSGCLDALFAPLLPLRWQECCCLPSVLVWSC